MGHFNALYSIKIAPRFEKFRSKQFSIPSTWAIRELLRGLPTSFLPRDSRLCAFQSGVRLSHEYLPPTSNLPTMNSCLRGEPKSSHQGQQLLFWSHWILKEYFKEKNRLLGSFSNPMSCSILEDCEQQQQHHVIVSRNARWAIDAAKYSLKRACWYMWIQVLFQKRASGWRFVALDDSFCRACTCEWTECCEKKTIRCWHSKYSLPGPYRPRPILLSCYPCRYMTCVNYFQQVPMRRFPYVWYMPFDRAVWIVVNERV